MTRSLWFTMAVFLLFSLGMWLLQAYMFLRLAEVVAR